MADEAKKAVPEAEVVVSDVPEAVVVEKEVPPQPEPEPEPAKVEKSIAEEAVKDEAVDSKGKIAGTISFKEESNKVDDLVDREKRALDEFKQLIREALHKHEFTPPPPPAKEEQPKPSEDKKEEEPKAEEKKEEEKKEEEPKAEEKAEPCEPEEKKIAGEPCEPEEKKIAGEPCEREEKRAGEKEAVAEPSVSAVEEVKETIVHEVIPPAPAAPCEEAAPAEEVSIWGVPLLADERTDAVLLKFLRARDFKVKDAFAMLKSVVAWRKEFKIDEVLEEESGIVEGLEKVVFIHGVDKEGHPVCYNAFGEFQDKELYNNTFADGEKRAKFLNWYIQFLEKNIRKLDYSPDGTCTIVQITDLKNSPGLILFKKDFRQSTNQALQLLQDNYPEFVAKQVFINVPWWYVAYNRMISPFFTQRTKSKFVFAGPTKTTETLFKYIAPEHVPSQYGGLSKEDDHEFTPADCATEEIIKPTCKHTVEFPIPEAGTLVWQVRVLGWDVSYGAEFVPSAEGTYIWIVQKPRKIGASDEQVISCNFKIGETGKVVLTFDNPSSKKKKLLYRFKIIKSSE